MPLPNISSIQLNMQRAESVLAQVRMTAEDPLAGAPQAKAALTALAEVHMHIARLSDALRDAADARDAD